MIVTKALFIPFYYIELNITNVLRGLRQNYLKPINQKKTCFLF